MAAAAWIASSQRRPGPRRLTPLTTGQPPSRSSGEQEQPGRPDDESDCSGQHRRAGRRAAKRWTRPHGPLRARPKRGQQAFIACDAGSLAGGRGRAAAALRQLLHAAAAAAIAAPRAARVCWARPGCRPTGGGWGGGEGLWATLGTNTI